MAIVLNLKEINFNAFFFKSSSICRKSLTGCDVVLKPPWIPTDSQNEIEKKTIFYRWNYRQYRP